MTRLYGMTIKIVPESHVDHGISRDQLAWALSEVADRTEFFIATLTVPTMYGSVPCALVGPAGGGAPVAESDVRYVVRGERRWASRVLRAQQSHPWLPAFAPAKVQTQTVTLIGGPADGHEELVLYTAYGGPQATREPGDPAIASWDELVASREFWAQHALVE